MGDKEGLVDGSCPDPAVGVEETEIGENRRAGNGP